MNLTWSERVEEELAKLGVEDTEALMERWAKEIGECEYEGDDGMSPRSGAGYVRRLEYGERVAHEVHKLLGPSNAIEYARVVTKHCRRIVDDFEGDERTSAECAERVVDVYFSEPDPGPE